MAAKKTSTDDAEKSKPEPDIFQAACDKLGDVEKEGIVVIGDTPYDAVAARKAGLGCVGVLSGAWSEKKLFESGCSKVFTDVSEICEDRYRVIFG